MFKLWVFRMKCEYGSLALLEKVRRLRIKPTFFFGCKLWALPNATTLSHSSPHLLIRPYARPASFALPGS